MVSGTKPANRMADPKGLMFSRFLKIELDSSGWRRMQGFIKEYGTVRAVRWIGYSIIPKERD